jgi:hypothetical protein
MRKIRLDSDALRVESFVPAEQVAMRGTVRGMASLYWEDCSPSETCPGGYPCDPSQQSCGGTCHENTCHPGCGGGSAGCSGGCSGVTWCYVATTCIDQDPTNGLPDC